MNCTQSSDGESQWSVGYMKLSDKPVLDKPGVILIYLSKL